MPNLRISTTFQINTVKWESQTVWFIDVRMLPLRTKLYSCRDEERGLKDGRARPTFTIRCARAGVACSPFHLAVSWYEETRQVTCTYVINGNLLAWRLYHLQQKPCDCNGQLFFVDLSRIIKIVLIQCYICIRNYFFVVYVCMITFLLDFYNSKNINVNT